MNIRIIALPLLRRRRFRSAPATPLDRRDHAASADHTPAVPSPRLHRPSPRARKAPRPRAPLPPISSSAHGAAFVQPPPPSPLAGDGTPAAFSMDQLIQRAKYSNFDSQVAFEQFVQAKLSAQNAMLNLLPHFSTITILNVASLNLLNVAKSVGDLVPFLLPNHWFHARGERFQSDAEYDGWVLMRADSVNIVEGLIFAVARDQDSFSFFMRTRTRFGRSATRSSNASIPA